MRGSSRGRIIWVQSWYAAAPCLGSMMTPLEAHLTEENGRQALEIKLLKEKIDLLIRRILGRSSEQLDEQ